MSENFILKVVEERGKKKSHMLVLGERASHPMSPPLRETNRSAKICRKTTYNNVK